MKFNVGDVVSYLNYGVCRVEGVVTRVAMVSSHKTEYYVLQPTSNPKLSISIPTKNQELTEKMKNVLSVAEINSLISEKSAEMVLSDNKFERQIQYKTVFDSDNRRELIKLIKALYKYKVETESQQKRFPMLDRDVLKKAGSILQEEFSFVLGIKKEDVLSFVVNV